MFDPVGFQELARPLYWFMTLGKPETKQMRDELLDLLHHTGESIRSLVRLDQHLFSVNESDFQDSFRDIFNECRLSYTAGDAPDKARSHCTDIRRDLKRISFKAAKLFRTELGKWSEVNRAFDRLVYADIDFLAGFADALKRLEAELEEVSRLLTGGDSDQAWQKYEALRQSVRRDVTALTNEIDALRAAEDHIRLNLT